MEEIIIIERVGEIERRGLAEISWRRGEKEKRRRN